MPTDREISTTTEVSYVLRRDREVFGRYLLEKQVGKGGMGVVWKARDLLLERTVALKFLADIPLNDAVTRDDLKRETRRSLDLTHPNIVRIHDFVEDDSLAAIVMEYVDGASLSEMRVRLPSRHFEADDLAAWTGALCSALAYAHDTGLCVHRDLKPGNLMVNSRGGLKVTDFGISCSLQNTAARVSAWASTGGTLGYMSPQQLRGELASPSDDIYSLGATLYELLTGRPPFYSGDIGYQVREIVPEGVNERRRKLGLPGAQVVPSAWEETIAACLAKHPAQRPPSAEAIALRLGLAYTPLAETSTGVGQPSDMTMIGPLVVLPESGSPRPVRSRFEKWTAFLPFALQDAGRLLIILGCIALGVLAWVVILHRPSVVPVAASVSDEKAHLAAPQTSISPAPARMIEQPAADVAAHAAANVATTDDAPNERASSNSLSQISPSQPAATPPTLNQVTLETKPAGIPFQVFASAYETPSAEVVQSGETPAVIALPPGSYRVVYSPSGLTSRATTIAVQGSVARKFYEEFPHGTVKIRTEPDGAEVFCDNVDVGAGPEEIDLLPGPHDITAERNGRTSRVHHIELTDAAEQSVTIDFRTGSSTGSHARHKKPKEDASMLAKIGRSIKGFFGGDSSKKH